MYNHRVLPEIPNLIFTAYSMFGPSVFNGLLTGEWIVNYMHQSWSEEDLQQLAVTYDYPVLSRKLLFDTHDYYLNAVLKSFDPFFKSGELSKKELIKCNLNFIYHGAPVLKEFNFYPVKHIR